MSKNVLDDISFDGLGLLMFLAREKDKNNIVDMGNREIARRINKSESWVRSIIKIFTKKNLTNAVQNALSNAPSNSTKHPLRVNVTLLFEESKNALSNAPQNAVKDEKFEDIWKLYGKIGSKKLAKARYEKLSDVKKEALAKSIPYYKAFHNPEYYEHLSTYISKEGWNGIEYYNGTPIPKVNYHIAKADAFIIWFNNGVRGSNIPQISELTPSRLRMLNICYTLCNKEMKKIMGILLTNQRYIDMANKGMIDFDYIFKPENMRRICENGGN